MADSSPLAHSPTLSAGTAHPPGDDDQLAAGTAVGDYVIERFIGAGAMGEVYAGRHPVIGKRVAIKVLRVELAASAEAAERFIREARAVNQIDHENVVDVFAFGRLDDGRLYLVMDLVAGRSLRAHLVDGPLDAGLALDVLDTIASALDAAHARGVVHRDLKPDNIVLADPAPRSGTDPSASVHRRPSKVFVLDFGIAKLISKANEGKPAAPGTLTGAGTWLGTPSYMAPEQWSADGAGPASDRYALGVIAFELLAGAPPFSASSVPAMMEQHFRAEVPTLSSRGAVGIPEAVDDVLRKALAKDPDARFASARELVEALRAAVGTVKSRARGAVAPPSKPRALWIPAAAGLAVLGVAVIAVVAARRGERTGTPSSSASTTPPPGSVTIDVLSTPPGAQVRSATGAVGVTPLQIVAKPGDHLELVVRKPGFLPERRTVTAGPSGSVVRVSLGEVVQFQGTWRLANGELRHFERRGDEVDVFKLRELAGQREYFKQYRFELADHGVVFGGEDVVIDPRAPNEPSCHVRMRVDYHYDPARDVLEQRREKVKIDLEGGTCVVHSRDIEPVLLARVGETADTYELATPVGKPIPDKKQLEPIRKKSPPIQAQKNVLPLDPIAKSKAERQQKQKLAPKPEPKQAKKPTPTYTSPKNVVSGSEQNLTPAPQAQIIPQPQAPPPQANEPIPQQIQKK